MIPTTIGEDLYCEYASIDSLLITVRVDSSLQYMNTRIVNTSTYKEATPSEHTDLRMAVKLWADSEFKHTMFLQHYLLKMGFGSDQL